MNKRSTQQPRRASTVGMTTRRRVVRGKPVGAVVAAAKILRLLAKARQPLGVSRIAEETGLYPGTTFNILNTLAAEELVVFESASKSYFLDTGVLDLAHGLLMANGIVDHARPRLRQLAELAQSTAYLLQLVGEAETILIDSVNGNPAAEFNLAAGRRYFGLLSAPGQIIAGHSNLSKARISELFQETNFQVPPDFDQWHGAVCRVRDLGFAVDRDSTLRGLVSLAAPIFNKSNELVMIVGCIGLSDQLPEAETGPLARDLTAAATEIAKSIDLVRLS